jgi:glycosyltransferase involved in cell wall biosynthesis
LKAQAARLGVDRAVHFLGFRDDVPNILAAADLFIVASEMEGLNSSVLEAMSAGLPVVATDAGGLPEAVADNVTGRVVPARNPPALAAAVCELLADPDRRRLMGEAGRNSLLARFTIDRMVDDTLRLYMDMMKKNDVPLSPGPWPLPPASSS